MTHVTKQEMLECIRAGWRLRFLPRSISGVASGDYDEQGQERDLWLDRFRADDHPELELEWAAMSLWEDDAIRLVEGEEDCFGLFVLREIAPPHAEVYAVAVADLREER